MANLEEIIAAKAASDSQWKNQHQADRQAVTEMQDCGIELIVTDPAQYIRYLNMQGDNPAYSAGNVAIVLAGTGKVWARTWRELTVEMPLETVQKVYTGKTKSRFALVLGTKRIKFYGKGGSEGEMCDKITQRTTLTLPGDLKLPVTWVKETCRFYTCETVEVTPTQAEEAARAAAEVATPVRRTLVLISLPAATALRKRVSNTGSAAPSSRAMAIAPLTWERI